MGNGIGATNETKESKLEKFTMCINEVIDIINTSEHKISNFNNRIIGQETEVEGKSPDAVELPGQVGTLENTIGNLRTSAMRMTSTINRLVNSGVA